MERRIKEQEDCRYDFPCDGHSDVEGGIGECKYDSGK